MAKRQTKISGRAEADGEQVAIGDVAKAAGVSIATVSRVLNGISGQASTETANRVRIAVEQLGYRPSRAGAALRSNKSKMVALLVSNVKNAYIGAVAAAIERELRSEGMITILCETSDDPETQDSFLREMAAQRVAGAILFGCVKSPELEKMSSNGATMVFVHRRSPYDEPTAFVGVDNVAAAQQVAQSFLARDLFPCGLLYGAADSSAAADRIRGFTETLAGQGHALPPPMIRHLKDRNFLKAGYEAARAIHEIEPGIRALACTSDVLAYGAYRYLVEQNLRIPEDVVLFGFDDNPLNAYIATWLETVRLPTEELGRKAVELLRGLWREELSPGSQIILPHYLVRRDPSSAPPG